MRFALISVFVVVAVVGCAKSPESISPSYVSERLYYSWSCQQLAEEDTRLADAYVDAAKRQKQARANDIAGVILIGLPVSSLSGSNIAPEIARLKGEQAAIRNARRKKGC